MRTFVDTSALYALLVRSDEHHPRAAGVWARLLSDRAPLVTHNYVLLETAVLLQHRIGVEAVEDLRRRVTPVIESLWVGAPEHEAALIAVAASKRRDVSIVDRVSFHVMRTLDVDRAFAFDQHFSDEGFTLVSG